MEWHPSGSGSAEKQTIAVKAFALVLKNAISIDISIQVA
jgi:hypothetical protein